MAQAPKVAVILAGSGHMDGSEIRESVFALLALDQHGAQVQCFAPNADQASVMDHATKAPTSEKRNMLSESSRIARAGQCKDLAQARVEDFDALVIPGGFGLAKNLCTWATKGVHAEVRPDVEAFVNGFFDAGKPVGAICIAPALVALCLHGQKRSARLTLGDASCQASMEQLGQHYQVVPSSREVVVDEALKLATAPAYMFGDARLNDVWIGIERCVAEVLRLA